MNNYDDYTDTLGLGRLQKVKPGGRVFEYVYEDDAADGSKASDTVPHRLVRPNGSVTSYKYDELFRLKSIENRKQNGALIGSNVYTYNKAHMRKREVVTGAPISVTKLFRTYSSAVLNQLDSTTNPDRDEYEYDADGNMTVGYTAAGFNSSNGVYTPTGYKFNASYDAENRLQSISYTDTANATYTRYFIYAADGFVARQKESKTVGGVTTWLSDNAFIRDGYNCLQERQKGNNSVLRAYAWDPTAPGGIGGLLEMKQKDTSAAWHYYSYYYDGRGNVSALTDENGNVVCEYRYEPFGGVIGRTLATGFIEQPYRFSTKYHYTSNGISNYGIVDYGYRFYVVSLGRWLTQDPIGEAGGVNLYGFVGNNGVNFVDLMGLTPDQIKNVKKNKMTKEDIDELTMQWNRNRQGYLKGWGWGYYTFSIDYNMGVVKSLFNENSWNIDNKTKASLIRDFSALGTQGIGASMNIVITAAQSIKTDELMDAGQQYYYNRHNCSHYARSLYDYLSERVDSDVKVFGVNRDPDKAYGEHFYVIVIIDNKMYSYDPWAANPYVENPKELIGTNVKKLRKEEKLITKEDMIW